MLRDKPIALDNDFTWHKDISVPNGAGERAQIHGLVGTTAFIAATLDGPAIHTDLTGIPVTERPNKWGRYFFVLDGGVSRARLAGHVSDDPGVWICVVLPGGFRVWDQRRVIATRQI